MFFMVVIKELYWAQTTEMGRALPLAALDVCRKSKSPPKE